MRETLLGLLMVALTAAALYWYSIVRRNRCQCPFCGRRVTWDDINCPHCGDDMKLRHRIKG
jgi:hypothetical protein